MQDPFRAMAIMAHPDDIEVNCAGTIAKWRDAGAEITYILVTDGASGSNDEGVNPHELAALREREQQSAAELLNVSSVIFLRHRDTTLEPTMALRKQLTRLIRQYKPHRLVTHDPAKIYLEDYYINHPDHRATGEAAIYAAFPSSESRLAFPELLDEGILPHKVPEIWLSLPEQANHYEDITGYWNIKEQAMRTHQSQIGDDTLTWIKERNQQWGKRINTDFAEEYRIIRRR